ncbi:hypothetical protein MMC21_003048 [Puttea exsequens]|nr:hypothetical protein [Puttea exsequens]
MSLTTDTLTSFSKNANLVASGGSSPIITAPVLQGMGFVTAIYKDATPYIDSSVFFNTIIPVSSPAIAATKYKLLLDDRKSDLAQDMSAQSKLNSIYYSGKALAKFPAAIHAVHDLAGDVATAQAGLTKLEDAYELFASNKQTYPLVYESQWGGVVSTALYVTGNNDDDFGNTYYNDHHFHWSYFLHAAAMIGHLDPVWLTPAHKDWINTLVRDAANPSTQDPYFPFQRSFDWYNGHSWAKGLFDSGDGKVQESTSQDALFSYGMKMWGRVIGDAAMKSLGNLMLAVPKRSFHECFLLESDDVNQPANYIANKIAGTLFENKVDHVTYFGANLEYIQVYLRKLYGSVSSVAGG